MADETAAAPAPDTGLKSALTASLTAIADMDLNACLKRKVELLGDARSYDHLSPDELIEFHALSVRLRQMTQAAGKPAAAKRGRPSTKTDVAAVADDFA